MVTTKRQIMRDRDRFGGFTAENETITASEPSIFASPSDLSSPNRFAPENSIMRAMPAEPAIEPEPRAAMPVEPLYSTRETVKAAPELPKRPEKEKVQLEKEDLMPSIKTRRLVDRPVEDEFERAELSDVIPERRSKLTPKAKIMLFVYVAVALVLAIAVIATGVSVARTAREADSLSASIASKQSVIAEQQAQIALGTDPDAIRDMAIDLGMTYASEPQFTAKLVEKTDYPTPEPHTNAFDSFCDVMSKIVN